MDIRKTLNEKPALRLAVAGAVCAVALALLAWQFSGGRSPDAGYAGKTFFSDDDGKSWFIDDESKLPPFDHNGKQACRAAVYRCGSGKPFVALLEKYSDKQLADFEQQKKAAAERDPKAPPPKGMSLQTPMEVKRPGDSGWTPCPGEPKFDNAAYQKVVNPVCPDGSGTMTIVHPSDPDAR